MTLFKLISPLLIVLSLIGCSSTAEVASSPAGIYHASYYQKTEFKLVDNTTVKKDFSSDHQLMMSLINRPMTADRLMMLSFTQQAQSQADEFVNYVSIRGEKTDDKRYFSKQSTYTHLIEKDINAVEINGTL